MQQLTLSNFLWNTLSFFDFVSPKTNCAILLIEFNHTIFVVLFFICGALFYLLFKKNLYSYLKYFIIFEFVLFLGFFFKVVCLKKKKKKVFL
jgi:hypothetical protein